MNSYSLPLPVSVTITRNSFRSVWTSSHYSAQPLAPISHEGSPMCSLVHPVGSCEGLACIAHPYPFLSISVTRSSIKSHYYITSGHAASGRVTLLCRVSLHRVSLHRVTSHWVVLHWIASHQVVSLSLLGSCSIGSHWVMLHWVGTLSYVGSHSIGSHCIRSCSIGSRYIGFALCFSPHHFSFCLCVPEPFPLL